MKVVVNGLECTISLICMFKCNLHFFEIRLDWTVCSSMIMFGNEFQSLIVLARKLCLYLFVLAPTLTNFSGGIIWYPVAP